MPNVESDKRAGIPVSARPHPPGDAGPRLTLQEMARRIRDARTPSMQAFAEMVVSRAYPNKRAKLTERQIAQCLLDYVRASVRYRPDPPMMELVKSAPITLCVDGAPICIPVGDCDDLVVALAGLMIAYGMDVVILRQDFGPDEDEHVLVAFKDSDGSWLSADPSHNTAPVGYRAQARREDFIDPTDIDALGLRGVETDGTFVGVGKLPASQTRSGRRIRVSRNVIFEQAARRGPRFVGDNAIDVLRYRAMWDRYVMDTVCALYAMGWAAGQAAANGGQLPSLQVFQQQAATGTTATNVVACAAPWAPDVAGEVLVFPKGPMTTAQLQSFATALNGVADALLGAWNANANLDDYTINSQAQTILTSLKSAVEAAGQQGRTLIAGNAPGMAAAISQGPDTSTQAQVIAALEGAGIIVAGYLKVYTMVAGGVIVGAATAAQTLAEGAGNIIKAGTSPWLWVSLAVIAASAATAALVYGAHEVIPLVKAHMDAAGRTASPVASERRRSKSSWKKYRRAA